jgi:hypothetical protein
MFNKKILIAYKVFFAGLGLFAVLQETITLINRGTYNFVNFWSYFTNQSNLFAEIMLLVGAYAVWRGIKSEKIALLRGASSLYMVITGVVFAVLLSGGDPSKLTAVPIDNTILHQIMPIVMALDWIINPPAKRLKFVKGLLWLAYPIFYAACALVRGALTGWYPYEFFDPDVSNGYLNVLITILEIAGFVVAMDWLMTRLPLKKAKAHRKS